MLPKHVFRVGLSDQLFSNCDASDLWAVMNWVVPWRLGDRRLYEKYFVKAINDGHKNIHSDLAAQRTRELHKHLSTAMFPPVGEGALFHQYAPEIDGKDDSETTARKALEALASYEEVTPVEMAKRLLAMDRKARTRFGVASSRAKSARFQPCSNSGREKTKWRTNDVEV